SAPFLRCCGAETHELQERGLRGPPLIANSEAFQPACLKLSEELFGRGHKPLGCDFDGQNHRENSHRNAFLPGCLQFTRTYSRTTIGTLQSNFKLFRVI